MKEIVFMLEEGSATALLASCAQGRRPDAMVRIACRSLEAFYLGDLRAVEHGLESRGLANKQERAKFRDPDRLDNPFQELAKLTNKTYQKVGGSRAIAPYLALQSPRSRSFHHLVEAVRSTIVSLEK